MSSPLLCAFPLALAAIVCTACGQPSGDNVPLGPPLDQGAEATLDMRGVVDSRDLDSDMDLRAEDMTVSSGEPDAFPSAPDSDLDRDDKGDASPPDLPVIEPGEYDEVDPLATLGEPKIVGEGVIQGFMRSMKWRHDLQRLEIAYAIGDRRVDTPSSDLYTAQEGDAEWVVHPSRTMLLDPSTDQLEVLYQFHAQTREGFSQCEALEHSGAVLCYEHKKKRDNLTGWLDSGDGITAPFQWDKLPEEALFADDTPLPKGLHLDKRLVDVIEHADGHLYMTVNQKRRLSWVVRTQRDAPSHVVEFETVDPKEDQGEEVDPNVPTPAYFMAWSVNEDALYFTTIGDISEKMGRVWFARVDDDGSLQTPEPFTPDAFDQPWGLAFDAAGNLYVASKFDVRVYDAEANLLGTIAVVSEEERAMRNPPTVNAIAFGGPDGTDLYVSLGASVVNGFGGVVWNQSGLYTAGKLLRYKSAIPGAWRRRLR